MSSDLVIYAKPAGTVVQLTLDSGQVIKTGSTTAHGRDDAHVLVLPDSTHGQGSVLTVTCDGCVSQSVRGIVHPHDDDGDALYQFDDFGTLAAILPPPTPAPPNPALDPLLIIQATYEAGDFDLSTHDGCGLFTEACCANLAQQVSPAWGHIRKTGAQNQFNGHAVDALYLLGGQGYGVYDIIHDSVAPDASPSCNWKDPGDPSLWMPPV